jgi:hypothetical protein
MQSSVAHNLSIDGGSYTKGLLGLSLFPSSAAKTNESRYEADIDYLLKKIGSRFVGSRVLLEYGLFPQKSVVIQPRPLDPKNDDPFADRMDAQTLADNDENSALRGTVANDGRKGTGKGCDAIIKFNPGVYRDWEATALTGSGSRENARNRQDFANSQTSDRILLHELIHGLSDVSGTNAELVGAPNPWGNLEEFTAVVIANVYEAECSGVGRPLLLYGHSFTPMQGGKLELLRNSQNFYKQYANEMQSVCTNRPHLARQLKTATRISHNPFVYCSI